MTTTNDIHTSTHPWTAAQDEKLRAMVRDRKSLDEIARTLHRTRDAVAQRAGELGVTARA